MIEPIIKFVLILVLLVIVYQDLKERLIDWFLIPIVGLCSGYLYYDSSLPKLFYSSIMINLTIVCSILAILFLYTKLKMKMEFKEVFGSADILLFIALAFSFSSVSFLVIFIFSLFFSLLIHLILKKNSKDHLAPLAGYMSLFYSIVYLAFWLGITDSLYKI